MKDKIKIPEVVGFGFQAPVNQLSDKLRTPLVKAVPKARKKKLTDL